MATTNTPCNSNFIAHQKSNDLSGSSILNTLAKLLNFKREPRVATFTDLHHLPDHLKNDIGFKDTYPSICRRFNTPTL